MTRRTLGWWKGAALLVQKDPNHPPPTPPVVTLVLSEPRVAAYVTVPVSSGAELLAERRRVGPQRKAYADDGPMLESRNVLATLLAGLRVKVSF